MRTIAVWSLVIRHFLFLLDSATCDTLLAASNAKGRQHVGVVASLAQWPPKYTLHPGSVSDTVSYAPGYLRGALKDGNRGRCSSFWGGAKGRFTIKVLEDGYLILHVIGRI
jgi:hypothetical protein